MRLSRGQKDKTFYENKLMKKRSKLEHQLCPDMSYFFLEKKKIYKTGFSESRIAQFYISQPRIFLLLHSVLEKEKYM